MTICREICNPEWKHFPSFRNSAAEFASLSHYRIIVNSGRMADRLEYSIARFEILWKLAPALFSFVNFTYSIHTLLAICSTNVQVVSFLRYILESCCLPLLKNLLLSRNSLLASCSQFLLNFPRKLCSIANFLHSHIRAESSFNNFLLRHWSRRRSFLLQLDQSLHQQSFEALSFCWTSETYFTTKNFCRFFIPRDFFCTANI